VIVVNDGSVDATPEIVTSWPARIRTCVVHHPKTAATAARCIGFRSATKELIFYTDGDANTSCGTKVL
jgi:glycosyltransferase involved in cell wall biosynthesis